MRKRTKIPNMQRRQKERVLRPQKTASEPASSEFDETQMTALMAKAEAAWVSNGGQTRYFVHGPTGLHSQQEPDGTWRIPFQDGLGSIRSVTDEALSILESREYDPYGNLVGTQGTPQTPFGFTGEMTDPNGLVYLRNRYYDPSLGVFPNLDPVEGAPDIPMSLNRYSYAQGNPINLTDPSGTIPQMVSSLQSMAISNPMGLHRLVNSINSDCYGSSPRQQEYDDCSCYRILDAKYGGASLYEECLAGNLPACPPSSSPTPPSVTCPGTATTVYPNISNQCCYNYIPSNAVGYALDNVANLPSPGYENWGGQGGDCANFVSQSLRDGNLPMHDPFGDEPGWGCKTQATLTCHATNQNWTVALDLRNYLVDHIGASVVSVPSPVNQDPELMQPDSLANLAATLSAIQPGDVLYMPAGSASAHVAVVVQQGPAYASWQDFLSQQNPLPHNVPYVVDHGFRTQGFEPRPFYLVGWPPPGGGYFDGTEDWEFIQMSNSPIRCVPVDKIIPFIPLEER
jgi:RHS repeat-associated protein